MGRLDIFNFIGTDIFMAAKVYKIIKVQISKSKKMKSLIPLSLMIHSEIILIGVQRANSCGKVVQIRDLTESLGGSLDICGHTVYGPLVVKLFLIGRTQ